MILYDTELERLDQAAASGPKAVAELLDQITGVAAARLDDDRDGKRQDSILISPSFDASRRAGTNDLADLLSTTHARIDTAARVDACISLLRLPDSQLTGPHADAALDTAQRTLSALLVEHPVLLHPRLMFRDKPLFRTEYAPLAHLIASTPRAEFPRAAHGIEPARLAGLANHWCLRVGLRQKASKPQRLNRTPSYQGNSMLQSVQRHLFPRVRMLASVLELDGLHAARRPKASALPESALKSTDLQKVVAISLLAHCGIRPIHECNCDVTGFVEGLKRSGMADEAWFLQALERDIVRWLNPWGQLPSPFDGVEGVRRLAHVLVELNPAGLPRSPESALMSHPVAMPDVVAWLIPALFDSSTRRAEATGTTFKQFPASADSETAQRMLLMLAELDPVAVADGSYVRRFKEALQDAPINREPVWEAAMTAALMSYAMRTVPTVQPVASAEQTVVQPVRPRRALV